MYITKIPKSKFYQVVYFKNRKRTTVSTKTSIKKEADKFLKTFRTTYKPNAQIEEVIQKEKTTVITLLDFKEEYLNFVSSLKSPTYIKSIKLSFRQFYNFIGNIPLSEIDVRNP